MTSRWQAKQIWWVPFLLAIFSLCVPVAKASQVQPAAETDSIRSQFEDLIQQRINFYNNAFPELQFVHLRGGLGWSVDMQFVPILLGQAPTSLDYEHPASARDDLMVVSFKRLEIMLRDSHPSASLFRKSTDGLARRRNVCIITLNPDALATSDVDATSEMLNLPRTMVERVHPARYLDTEDHVAFAIDHEAFHCLDSMYNGPVPRSHQPYGRNYALFRNENGADAFAVAMNIHRHGELTRYARNIMNVRALALMDDPDHYTWAIIQHVLELNPATVAATPVQSLFAVAGRIRDRLAPAYEQYVAYRVAVHEMRSQLGNQESAAVSVAHGVVAHESNIKTVALVKQTRFWFNQLFTDEPFSLMRERLSAFW